MRRSSLVIVSRGLALLALLAALAACGPSQPPAAPTGAPAASPIPAAQAQAEPSPGPAAQPQASPRPTQAAPAPFVPLHYDDFSQLAGGLSPLLVDQQGTAEGYSAEGYAFSTASPDQLLYRLLPGPSFAPTRYAVDLLPTEGRGVFGLLLEVRGDPDDAASLAYYGAGLTMSGDAVLFTKAAGDDLQVIQIAQAATPPLELGEPVRFAVDRAPGGLIVIVNGAVVLRAPADGPQRGATGFFARATDRLAVRFDNLLLSAAEPQAESACAGIRPLFVVDSAGEAMRGEDVAVAQRRLARLGYTPGPGGAYWPQTADAVAQFQARNGLPANGALGPETWCALLSSEAVLADREQSERAAGLARYRPVDISLEARLPAPLLVSVRGDDRLWQIALALPGRSSLHYIDTGGDALDPAWHAGRGLLAFSSLRGGRQTEAIWVFDIASGQAQQISPPALKGTFPTWSPDGRRLIFSGAAADGNDRTARIYIYNVDDGQLTRWGDEHGGWADWSRFGTLVFTRLTGRSFDLFAANVDGEDLVNLTDSADYHEDIAAWSPDGSMIAFVRNPKGDLADRQIYVMQADGSELRQLTTLPGPNSNPTWLDETTIAFANQPSDEVRQIYLARLSGEISQLSANEDRLWFMSSFDPQP